MQAGGSWEFSSYNLHLCSTTTQHTKGPLLMAMTAKLWSINALSVELNMDRRTVGARLRGVPPDGRIQRSPAWLLSTALRALHVKGAAGMQSADVPPPPPAGYEILAEIPNQVHGALTIGWLRAVYSIGRIVLNLAPQASCSSEQARELALMVTVALIGRAESELRECGVPPFAEDMPSWLNMDAFEWSVVAE
jgi:hypothetical protein